MTTVIYNIPNISCGHCVHTIKNELEELSGVRAVSGNIEEKSVQIEFETPASEEKIKELLQEINYPVK